MQSIKGFNIREAEEKDLISCLILFKEFFKESKFDVKWSQERIVTVFQSSLTNPNFVLFVSENQEEIVGFIAGAVSNPLFSNDIIATELAWFVTKEYRGSTTGFRLLKTFEDWAKEKNSVIISMADIEGLNNLSSIYLKKGYTKSETTYNKRVL
tara:strand:- start:1601 stop:2062 length:462 start_codon:yes stop_codon:yes gene_type:complete